MRGSLKVQGIILGGMMIVGGGLMFAQSTDIKNNYTKVTAVITTVEYDCFVKNGRKKIVKKGTKTMAYMDCKIAPFIVGNFGFEKKHIKKRAKVNYEYTSPVDQDYHIGSFKRSSNVEKYLDGRKIKVFAHNQKAGTSKFITGNVFVDGS